MKILVTNEDLWDVSPLVRLSLFNNFYINGYIRDSLVYPISSALTKIKYANNTVSIKEIRHTVWTAKEK